MKAYDKLRPYSQIESCKCDSIDGLLLVDLLTDNPIHCIKCKNEIDPEQLDLPDETVEAIYQWKSVFNSLYLLWLDSGEYENWAKSRLLDNNGEVNKLGIEATKLLSKSTTAYLWWFWDVEDGDPTSCPVCSDLLDPNAKFGVGKCDKCKIYI